MCLPAFNPFCKIFALCSCCLLVVTGIAQIKHHALTNGFLDSAHNTRFATAADIAARAANITTATEGAPCTTSTFYMHIPALPGSKIDIKTVKATAAGDYIVAGSYATPGSNLVQGVLMRISNAGDITARQNIRISDGNTSILNAAVLPNGGVLIAGTLQNSPFNTFVALLNADFSTKWVRSFTMPEVPGKIITNVTGNGQLIVAVQLSTSVVGMIFNTPGGMMWSKTVTPAGFTGLVSFTDMPDGTIGLLTNCTQGGKKLTELIQLAVANGAITLNTVIGNDESYSLSATTFNGRLSAFGVIKKGQNYQLTRNSLYDAKTIETHQTFTLGANIGFGISAAMDNSGDGMGLCLPADEKLVFIKQFNYYQTTPEHTRSYSVPKASTISGVARSFDGGFLFGLNTKDSSEIILVKTDSIGILGGCAISANVTNFFVESYQIQNSPATDDIANSGLFGTTASSTYSTSLLAPRFDCRQNYCPEAPIEDTCLSTYYKIYRSHSYTNLAMASYLMTGNNQLMQTVRADRVTGYGNVLAYGLKLLDERGNYIKGAVPLSNGRNVVPDLRRMDDHHILLNTYSSDGGVPGYTFTLVSDNLEVLWNKSVKLPDIGGSSAGPSADDWIKDEEGNYYFVACHPGFNSPSKALIYKMDAAGNTVWTRGYSFTQQSFSTASAVTTKTSLVLIMGGSGGPSGTLRVDKKDGRVLNSYTYTSDFDGIVYHKFAAFYNGRIYCTTNDRAETFTLIVYDSTGKPLKIKGIPNISIPRASAFRDGFLYTETQHFTTTGAEEVALKFDTAANIIAATKYPLERFRLQKSMDVSPEGNIYTTGVFFENQYGYTYIRKYNNNTTLGTCGQPFTDFTLVDINPQVQPNTATPITATAEPFNMLINLVADNDVMAVSDILCSSTTQCNYIKLSGPAAVCQLNTPYTYGIKKNAGCTLTPIWAYDTAYAQVLKTTDTSITFIYKKTGNIKLKAMIDGGCKVYADSLPVTIQKQAATLTLGRDTALCPKDTLLLKAGAGFNTYTWQDGSGDSVYHVKQPGKYYVQVSNACNERYGDTIVIAGVNVPVLSIGNDTSVCLHDTVRLHATAGFTSYTWPPQVTANGRNAVYIPQQDVDIPVEATTKEGCPAADTISITVKTPRPISLGKDTSFCTGDSITLNAGAGYASYQWSDGSNGEQNVARSAGSYWVKAQDANSCYAADTLQVLAVYPLPTVSLGNPAPLCAGSKRVIDAGTFAGYLWQDGSTARYFTADTTGTYTVQVKNNNGCAGSGTIVVLDIMPVPADFLKSTDSLCQYDKLTLETVGDFSRYAWDNGATTPNIIVDVPGTYTLTVTSAAGCTGSDTETVVQKICMYGFYVPNAFTPNGDGKNDVFRPSLFGNVQAYLFCIYNRFGELVFKTSKPGDGWDGNYKGKPFDAGTTFVWRCQYQLQGDTPVSAKGYVVLIK